MPFPFQCLVSRAVSSHGSKDWTLFGACGPELVAQSNAGVKSLWPEQGIQPRDEQQHNDSPEPPGKRIKLETPKEQKPNFTSLVLSNDGRYLVGVTGEDKCIRVFQVDSPNGMQQLSQRCMSRRPCSITLTADDTTILCADKFGDVYALPLLPSLEDEQPETPKTEQPEQDYKPAANTFTVHSGRNRKTLEEQLKQKANKVAKPKEPARFKHDLLLGHVSMLTDIVYAKVDSRSYILTADRDEHIRVSRGQPQAHIIEGFCFGHEEFVSKLCLTQSGLLISGGGDESLFVWDWLNYRLLEKFPIRDTVVAHLQSRSDLSSMVSGDEGFQVAVSGIWNVSGIEEQSDEILVACEGVPALFGFKIGSAAASEDVIRLSGNALSVAFIQPAPRSIIVVSVDNFHKPGSTTQVRDDNDVSRLQYFSKSQDGQWDEDASIKADLAWFQSQGPENQHKLANSELAMGDTSKDGEIPKAADEKALQTWQSMLYHIENLRKRPGIED